MSAIDNAILITGSSGAAILIKSMLDASNLPQSAIANVGAELSRYIKPDIGLEFTIAGKKHYITTEIANDNSNNQQMKDFLGTIKTQHDMKAVGRLLNSYFSSIICVYGYVHENYKTEFSQLEQAIGSDFRAKKVIVDDKNYTIRLRCSDICAKIVIK